MRQDRTPQDSVSASERIQDRATLALTVPAELVEAIASRVAELVDQKGQAPVIELASEGAGRLTLTKAEAAEALGMSVDHLERHVLPDLRIVRSSRLRLVPVAELERWISENASRALEAR